MIEININLIYLSNKSDLDLDLSIHLFDLSDLDHDLSDLSVRYI